ncbi:MAG: zinc metallopeptidase, partial [bacterium]
KGIRIVDASSEEKLKQSIKEVSEETIKSINNMSVMKKLTLRSIVLLNKLSDISYLLIGTIPDLKLKIQSGIKYGGYNPSFNYVISGRTGSLLHEIGHAINKNKNFFTRIPLRLKIVSSLVLTPLAILTAMFHKKENNNPENKTFLTKTKDFVKERIGLTIAVLSLLSLVEEVLASLRAFKFTEKSKLMTEAIKKEHNKILLMAFGTYVADAAILTGMAKTAVWVKNKVTGDK